MLRTLKRGGYSLVFISERISGAPKAICEPYTNMVVEKGHVVTEGLRYKLPVALTKNDIGDIVDGIAPRFKVLKNGIYDGIIDGSFCDNCGIATIEGLERDNHSFCPACYDKAEISVPDPDGDGDGDGKPNDTEVGIGDEE